MHGGARELCANGIQHGLARFAFVTGHAYLDEAVGIEHDVDFFQYGVGQAFVADPDDGAQGMRGGAQSAAGLRGEV